MFISNSPFTADSTVDNLQAQESIWHTYLEGEQGAAVEIPVNASGRYVRVQLGDTGVLSLAEVEVLAVPRATNLLPIGVASQSSIRFGGIPGRAISSAALDAVGIAVDGVAAMVPIVPGGVGSVIRGSRLADASADAGRVAKSGRTTVRRFMSKSEMKQLRKEGVKFDSSLGNSIPTTTTNFTPKNQGVARGRTGAPNAQYQVDLDVTGLRQGPPKTTKSGLPEYTIQGDLSPDRITNIQKVPK